MPIPKTFSNLGLVTLFAALQLALLVTMSGTVDAAPLRVYAAPIDPQTQPLLEVLNSQSRSGALVDEPLDVVVMETRTLVERAISEYRRVGHSADILLVPDVISAASLAQAGVLSPYPDADTGSLDRRFVDPEKRYFPTRVATIGIAFNRSARARPTEWQELTKGIAPEAIAWPSSKTSAVAQLLAATLTRADRVGWNFFRHLSIVGVIPVHDEAIALEALINGQVQYAIVPDYLAARAHAEGAPIHFTNPRSGSPVLSFPIGIGSGTPRLADAKRFVDYILSIAGQSEITRGGFRPVHPRVRPKPQFPTASSLKLLVLDQDRALAEQDKDLKRFQSIFSKP